MENSEFGFIALTAVEKALYSFDRLYSYVIPAELIPFAEKGKRVLIPFGRGARKLTGIIFKIEEREYDPFKLKKIHEVLDDKPCLNEEGLALAAFLKENTFCVYFDAVKCILPPALRDFENSGAKKSGKKLKSSERIVRLKLAPEDLPLDLTPKQKIVVEALENFSASVKELCYLCSTTASVIDNLLKKEVLEEVEPILNEAETFIKKSVSDIILTDTQNKVFSGLLTLLNSPEARCALLRGVTGSGKTSIFIKLIEETLNQNKTAIVLVPEISLTPQTIAIFKGFFGDNAAVIHSGLSMKRKTEEYERIKSGSAKIVIGTRSAIFAPIDNIGIIIIDEEGEHTYKSERSPRYHARDVAKQRCFRHNALLLLASATPSLESYRKAKTGKYALFEMTERYSGNKLPDVYTVDMKIENAYSETSAPVNFSEALISELRHNLEVGEQSLILLNRRGYYTYVCCASCGTVSACPNCAVPLTYHKTGDKLSCHYCGFSRPNAETCLNCGAKLRQTGTGTQRIEDELQSLLPKARILRMDADSVMSKGAYERKFESFGAHEYDIMLGTQMIAKGLDFSNVTLVGVLQIDKALYAGDYLGYERTFSLITQVVGRSGRGEKKGRAYLQTFTPDHYVLKLAARQDYVGFYEEETSIREVLLFPPFCDLCVIETVSINEVEALEAARAFSEIFSERLKQEAKPLPVRALGPVKNGIGSVNGRYRYRLIIKCKNSPPFRKAVSDSLILARNNSVQRFSSTNVSAWFE